MRHKLKLLPFCFLLFSYSTSLAKTLPTAEDISNPADSSKFIIESFARQSFEIRMRYEYRGRFATARDKEELARLAKSAGCRLNEIANAQKSIKKQIEDYEGNDWDEKYGASGLWRRLSGEIYETLLYKCETDFYGALTLEEEQRQEQLQRILREMDSLDRTAGRIEPRLLRGKVLAALSVVQPIYREAAIKQFSNFQEFSDVYQPTKAAIETVKLTTQADPNQLKVLLKTLQQNQHEKYLELVLELAFLQCRYVPTQLRETVEAFPQIEAFLSTLILSDLSQTVSEGKLRGQVLKDLSVFEAELAVGAAWRTGAEKYRGLLEVLSKTERFQRPLILYVTASAIYGDSPHEAIELLIQASKLQRVQGNNKLNVEAGDIAAKAAGLAYNLVVKDSNNCDLAVRAFENYLAVADGSVDEELEYAFAVVLDDCGRSSESRRLLKKIAGRKVGKFRNKASLRLAAEVVRRQQYKDSAQRIDLLRQFSSSITDSNDCVYADEVMSLLYSVIGEIEQLQMDAGDFYQILQDCRKLGRFCYECQQDKQSTLVFAEISILAARQDNGRFSAVERLLAGLKESDVSRDVFFFRCKARLLSAQAEYEQAAKLWAEICEMRKNELREVNRRSWRWWRAKFHELDCWAKSSEANKKSVCHTIEVLESSFIDIGLLWSEKLELLKKRCQCEAVTR